MQDVAGVPRATILLVAAVLIGILPLVPAAGNAPEPAAGEAVRPRPAVRSPVAAEAAVATLATAPGLEATLFAAEPMLSSPSSIDVDARGRVWVCEVLNYRAKKDSRPEGDRILVLEDADGDGRADRQVVFYQGPEVDSALGVCVIGEGPGRRVIVSCSPDVWVFHDDDGDLKADRKQPLFTKTGARQHDHGVHAFTVGPDGRWYFNCGNEGSGVCDAGGRPVSDRFGNEVRRGSVYRQGMVYRCLPDGSDVEVLGHNFRNNYEAAVDSFGMLWQSDNDDDGNKATRVNWVMEYGNYGYTDERNGAAWQAPRPNMEREIPDRHWHQNDPGVVPNLFVNGAGAPCGICVYEGSLLPERFHGAVVLCEAGRSQLLAYHVRPSGAGYAAVAETLVDGSADRWFRPSDVCVAPDGSLIVADWYDPGVGGHRMTDSQMGRVYRLAPAAAAWRVPAADFATVAGCVAALASPNLCTRATALERLAREPDAEAAVGEAFETATDPRHKARLAWAAGMLPGAAERWVGRLAAAADEPLRIIALRIARLTRGDVIGLVERLSRDQSAAVRRECSIALRGLEGERADRAWAVLASRHTAGDRWSLEAIGIGADGVHGSGRAGLWDGRLAALLTLTGADRTTPAVREIVWRSRAAASASMIGDRMLAADTPAAEAVALLRALDFQDPKQVAAVLPRLVMHLQGTEEKIRAVLPGLVMRLDPAQAADPTVADGIAAAVKAVAGTDEFISIVRRFGLEQRYCDDLVALAAAEGQMPQLAADAADAAVKGSEERVKAAMMRGDLAANRLLAAIGIRGSAAAIAILKGVIADTAAASETRAAAVRGLCRSRHGAQDLIALARQGGLGGPLSQVAVLAISGCPWPDVREAAAAVLPMPKAKGGGDLPPVSDLLRRKGNWAAGKAVFNGAASCAKCHVVDGAGKAVGPDLSGIGAKLSRQALYEAVLAPSAGISHGYETFLAVLEDGRTLPGLVVSKTPEEVVIRGADGIDSTFPAAEIEELRQQPLSLMPADIAATLSAQELVDLVAWLETLRTTR
jgi:putative membrane-bound dehydrogenase-like protein